MRIAILSDTHSRYATIEAALELVQRHKVDLLLHVDPLSPLDAKIERASYEAQRSYSIMSRR